MASLRCVAVDDGVALNRRYWEARADEYQADHGAALREAPLAWGTWRVPEAAVGALGDLRRCTVLELGCGGGQWSWALAREGVRVIGLDLSAAQLRHARALAPAVPFVQASAHAIPLADASVDVVLSDHGATTFVAPEVWLPEVARILRPGGRLAFCITSPWKAVCSDDRWQLTERLHRPYFGLGALTDGESVDWAPPHGEWIRLLRAHGFVVEALHELRPEPGTTTTYPWYATYDWASRWPAEDLWVAIRSAPVRARRRSR